MILNHNFKSALNIKLIEIKELKSMTDLTKMFNPDSVAIVGASNSEGKVGYIIVNNIKYDEIIIY